MKNVFLLIVFTLLVFSCGRNNSGQSSCRNRERMVLNCQVVNQPNYGYTYAQEMCNRQYSKDSCY